MGRTKQVARKSTGGKSPTWRISRSDSSSSSNEAKAEHVARRTRSVSQKETPRARPARAHRRYKPGQKALKDIRQLQATSNLLIPRSPFSRLVREIATASTIDNIPVRFHVGALKALQEATEAYITGLFEDANLCCIHTRRVTLMVRDIKLALRLRGESVV